MPGPLRRAGSTLLCDKARPLPTRRPPFVMPRLGWGPVRHKADALHSHSHRLIEAGEELTTCYGQLHRRSYTSDVCSNTTLGADWNLRAWARGRRCHLASHLLLACMYDRSCAHAVLVAVASRSNLGQVLPCTSRHLAICSSLAEARGMPCSPACMTVSGAPDDNGTPSARVQAAVLSFLPPSVRVRHRHRLAAARNETLPGE